MAYVYRHIRLDKNIPFYVGIGGDEKEKYTRANMYSGRNKYWYNIAKKTVYEVEIIIDEISWLDACKKEIEFIAKEKNRLSSLGQKAWNKGVPMREETKRKLSESKKGKPGHRGRKSTPEEIAKMVAKKIMTVYKFDLVGNFLAEYSRAEVAAEKTGLKMGSIGPACRGEFGTRKTNKHGGFLWSYEKSPQNWRL